MPNATSSPDTYTKDLDEKIALSVELQKLSSQEFDKQIVYIAGGGLALTLTFAKDIASVTSSYFVPLLLATWLFFAIALLINLFSYRRAAKNYDSSTSLHRHYRECHTTGKPIDQLKCDYWQVDLEKGNSQVNLLNIWSFNIVAAGIASFILFVLLNILNMPEKVSTTKQEPSDKPATDVHNEPYEGIKGIPAPSFLLTTPPPPIPQPTTPPPVSLTPPASSNPKSEG